MGDHPLTDLQPAPNWTVKDVLEDITNDTINLSSTTIAPVIAEKNIQLDDISQPYVAFATPPPSAPPWSGSTVNCHQIPASTSMDAGICRMMTKLNLETVDWQVQCRINLDGGANRSVTNNRKMLVNVRNIKKIPMAGVSDTGPAIHCTAIGYLP
jgi:hypothetical protein